MAFFGIGSYVYAFLASGHFGLHLPFFVVVPIVVVATAVSGLLIGAPTLRLRGDYLAIVTLGFGEITYLLLINLDRPVNITGGPSGIIGIDPPALAGFTLSRNTEYYYLFLAALALALIASVRLRHSRVGWAWQAIREDELAAKTMGINTTVAKLQAFAMGASFAGVGGSFLASWQRSVFPENFLFTESINILAMVILIFSHAARGVPGLPALPAARLRTHADGADGRPASGAACHRRPPRGAGGPGRVKTWSADSEDAQPERAPALRPAARRVAQCQCPAPRRRAVDAAGPGAVCRPGVTRGSTGR